MSSWSKSLIGVALNRHIVRMLCWFLFLLPFSLYVLLELDQLLDRPHTFDLGIVTVAAALGGLVLNAGVNLDGPKGKELIRVAQEFIAVVILMITFLPALHFVELMGGIQLISFEPDSIGAWARGFFFWTGVVSFYLAISLFIIALVDLVYAMVGIESVGDNEPSH